MSSVIRRWAVLGLAACGVLGTRAGAARASEADVVAPPRAGLTQEWVGFELTPVSLALPSSCCYDRPGHVQTFQSGPGASVRLFRHRWEHVYVIPIEAGVYVSSDNDTIFAHLETEGGVVVPGTDRRLEVGLGAGLGALAIRYADGCDGSCNVGGAGWLISFAARYLLVDRPTFTVGASARLIVPLEISQGDVWGYTIARGNVLLGGLEIGFGHA